MECPRSWMRSTTTRGCPTRRRPGQVARLRAVHRQRRVGWPRGPHRPDRLLLRLDLGQLLRVPVWQRVTLIAAGAGAGIAATFNTPIGGVLFAVEIMLHEVSARTLVPVTIATVTASYVGRLFFGSHPSFVIPAFETPYFHHTDPFVLIFYVGLGLLMGLVSVVYIRSIYAFEDFFDRRVRGNYYLRHMLGCLSVGVIMYALLRTTGHYHVRGGRVCHRAGRAVGGGVLVPAGPVRPEAAGNLADARLRRFGRSVLPRTVPGCHAGRGLRAGPAPALPGAANPPGRVCRRRHGRGGRRVNRSGPGRRSS